MNIGEDTNADDIVKTRRIQVTSENVREVAEDIQMDPTELERRYEEWKVADAKMFIEVLED